MPTSVTNILQTADISTSSADFQAPGTAAPGSTGRLADAGHVHPAASVGYQIVTGTFTATGDMVDGVNCGLDPSTILHATVSVSAPSGYKVVGGGYELATGVWSGTPWNGDNWGIVIVPAHASGGDGLYQNGPASDGSSWEFNAWIGFDGSLSSPAGAAPASTPLVTVYAICLEV